MELTAEIRRQRVESGKVVLVKVDLQGRSHEHRLYPIITATLVGHARVTGADAASPSRWGRRSSSALGTMAFADLGG